MDFHWYIINLILFDKELTVFPTCQARKICNSNVWIFRLISLAAWLVSCKSYVSTLNARCPQFAMILIRYWNFPFTLIFLGLLGRKSPFTWLLSVTHCSLFFFMAEQNFWAQKYNIVMVGIYGWNARKRRRSRKGENKWDKEGGREKQRNIERESREIGKMVEERESRLFLASEKRRSVGLGPLAFQRERDPRGCALPQLSSYDRWNCV